MPKIGSLGIPELLIILVVVLLIFGPRRLPEMAKGLGQSVREFRKGLRDMRKDIDEDVSLDEKAPGAPVSASTTAAAPAASATTAGATTAGATTAPVADAPQAGAATEKA